jgi:hypothetical protein
MRDLSLSPLTVFEVATYRNLRASETGAGIQANAITTCAAVNLNLSGIWLEALRCVFSGDSALDSKASFCNGLLGETKLGEGCTCSNLDLSSYDIYSGDFLCKANSESFSCFKRSLTTYQ